MQKKYDTSNLNIFLYVLLFLLLWEYLKITSFKDVFFPSPKEIGLAFIEEIKTGSLFLNSLQSLKRVMVGIGVGLLIGTVLGILCGYKKAVYHNLGWLIEIIRPIPPIAWIPLSILWFGIGDKPAYFLVSLGSFFPVFTNTFQGVIRIETKYINMSKSLGAPKVTILKNVIIPLLLPHLFTGLKIGIGTGWMIVVTAELVGAQDGLGYMIQLNRILLQIDDVIVGMLTIGFIGFSLQALVRWMEMITVPWMQRMSIIGRE